MKKALILATVVAISFGCSKKTSEEPKPVAAKGQNAQLHLVMEEDDDASPATVSTSSSSAGQFVTIGYNPFSTKPQVGYAAGALIPVVTFPTYSAQMASAGISEGCYNEYQSMYSKALSYLANPNEGTACDFVSELADVVENCSLIPAEARTAVKQMKDTVCR